MTSLEQKNTQRVVEFFATLSRGDLVHLKTFLTPDASWTPMVSGVPGEGAHVGRDAIIDGFLAPVRGLFEPGDPKVRIDQLSAQGSLVYAETHATGRVRANGKKYENRYCWAFEFQDGQIRTIREYMDSAYVMRTLFGT